MIRVYSYSDRCAVYGEALGKWGLRNQFLVAIEEMSEVQKAITKVIRAREDEDLAALFGGLVENLIEEIADATIMLEQLRYFFSIDEAVDEMMDKKIFRLEERISNGTA